MESALLQGRKKKKASRKGGKSPGWSWSMRLNVLTQPPLAHRHAAGACCASTTSIPVRTPNVCWMLGWCPDIACVHSCSYTCSGCACFLHTRRCVSAQVWAPWSCVGRCGSCPRTCAVCVWGCSFCPVLHVCVCGCSELVLCVFQSCKPLPTDTCYLSCCKKRQIPSLCACVCICI